MDIEQGKISLRGKRYAHYIIERFEHLVIYHDNESASGQESPKESSE